MIAVLLAAVAALPSATQRYRVEIAGQPVGFAELRVACDERECTVRWESALRAPEPAPDVVLGRIVEAVTEPDGRARSVRVLVDEGLGTREADVGAGPVPASAVELLLAATPDGERRCVTVREEATGDVGPACARRRGEWLEGESSASRCASARTPARRRSRWSSPRSTRASWPIPAADVPASPPRLFGTEVPLAPGAASARALRFCGIEAEPRRTARVAADIPRDFPDGATCREKTARYVAAAERKGFTARHVVGVAWDGSAFSWHEWAELWSEREWLPVDPLLPPGPRRRPALRARALPCRRPRRPPGRRPRDPRVLGPGVDRARQVAAPSRVPVAVRFLSLSDRSGSGSVRTPSRSRPTSPSSRGTAPAPPPSARATRARSAPAACGSPRRAGRARRWTARPPPPWCRVGAAADERRLAVAEARLALAARRTPPRARPTRRCARAAAAREPARPRGACPAIAASRATRSSAATSASPSSGVRKRRSTSQPRVRRDGVLRRAARGTCRRSRSTPRAESVSACARSTNRASDQIAFRPFSCSLPACAATPCASTRERRRRPCGA